MSGEQDPYEQLGWVHRDWSIKHRACLGLHQVLCICVAAVSLVFVSCLTVGAGVSLTLPPALVTFFSYWIALISLKMSVFVLSYYILFHHIWLLFRNSALSWMKMVGWILGRGEFWWGELGGELLLRVYFVIEDSIFNKKKLSHMNVWNARVSKSDLRPNLFLIKHSSS